MTPLVTVPAFVGSLMVTLGAAGFFARRLDRVGSRLGLPEAVLGLLTALAADGAELTSAIVALAKGAGAGAGLLPAPAAAGPELPPALGALGRGGGVVSLGVLLGSNVFNLAAMV